MSYINQDIGLQLFGTGQNLSSVCNGTDNDYPVRLNEVQSLGELYISKLLADPTFDMVRSLRIALIPLHE